MSGQTFSTFTEVGMIDARLKTGTITLPTTTSIPFRILTLKDVYGATSFSTVTISTQIGDTFEDGTTTRAINAAWGMTTLYAGKAGTWYTIGGSVLTTASISSLTVSSIFGLNNLVSTPYLATQLGSTVIGLGTAGYISSIPSIGGFVSTANLVNLVSTANLAGLVSTANLANLVSTANLATLVSTSYLATQLGSTVIGLGTAGYMSTVNLSNLVSTANLANLVSTANLANHISTANLVNLISTANLANLVSTANLANLVSTTYLATQLGSTVRGLGTAGYLSSINYSTVVLSSLTAQNLTSVQGYISSLTVDSLFLGSNSAFVDMGDVIATSLSTIQINVGTQFAVTISAQQLFVSSIQATNIIGALVTANLTSTVIGLGTVGYLSSAITNVGGFGFISTANLANLVSTANLANHISTANLANHISTANLANLVSTANFVNLVSTANLANLVSTSHLASQLGSTVIGLGTAGYISTIIFGPIVSTHNLANLVSTANLANLVSTANLANLVSTANLANLVSTANLANLVSTANFANLVSTANIANLVSTSFLTTQLGSTVIGLGTAGYISSSQLLSTTAGLSQYISSFIDPTELTSTVIGLGTQGFVSSLGLTYAVASTAQGLGTFGYTSTSQLLSTSLGLYQEIQNSPANIKQSNLTSTIIGLGTFGYLSTVVFGSIVSTANLANLVSTANLANLVSTANLANLVSTANLANLVSTANLANLVSTANLANLVSTTYLATQLGSTVRGLGTAGYLSSINYSTVSLSSLTAQNLTSLQGYISSLYVDSLFLGSNNAFIEMGDVVATSISTIQLNTGNLVGITLSTQQFFASSIQATNIIGALTTANLTSTVIGLGTVGYISTGLGGFSFVSTANLAGLVSTANLANHVSTANLATLVSTANLANLVSTANLANLVSTTYLATQLGSTVIGLGTVGYLSSIVFGSIVSTANLANLVSTANLVNLVSTANLVNLVSTANLVNLVSTANLVNLVSTANLVNLVSTANLSNLVSTTYLATQIGSTVIGLGTAGYISTAQFLSTTNGYSLNFNTQNASVSSLRFSTATANNAYISSLNIDQLTFGDGNGWADFGVLRALAISTLVVNTGILYATTVSTSQLVGVNFLAQSNLTSTVIGLGTVGYLSSVTAVNLTNLVSTANLANLVSTANLANLVSTANLANVVSTANLTNLVSTANLTNLVSTANLANLVSTSYLATQLGSTVRGLGTAGYVSSINYSTVVLSSLSAQNLTSVQGYISSLIVDSLQLGSNTAYIYMGDVIATSLSTVYVAAGSATILAISAQQLYVSSIQATNIIGALTTSNLTSTVIGLGTVGYLSTAINVGGFGFISTANLANLVSTANLANLVSTANLANLVSTANLANLVSTANLANLVSTANLANLVSTANLANLVSTTYLATQLGSTVRGLGTAGYLSSINYSTVALSSLTAQNLTSVQGYISSLTVDAFFLGSNSAFFNMGDVIATSLSTIQINVGTLFAVSMSTQQFFASSIQATNIIGALTTANLTSTVIGLGTVGYISTGLGGFSFVSTANLANLVSTANLANHISTANLANLVSTANLANLVSTANLANLVSTANLANLVSTANLANLISTANLSNLVSTTYIATQLGSTVIGLGTAGYISSGQLLSTSVGLSQYISSFIDPTELTSTVIGLGTQGFVSSLGLTYAVASTAQGLGTFGYTSTSQLLSTSLGLYQEIQNSPANIKQSNLTSTIIGLGTFGYLSTVVFGSIVSTANLANLVSTTNLVNLVSTANLTNHISTANLANLLSTANLANLVSTANLANHISTANLANLVSTSYLATQIGSTVIGLGTAGYISTSQLLSTSLGLNLFISTFFVDHPELQSTVAGLGTTGYLSTGFSTSISRSFLTSSLSTTNINTANLNSLTATISSLTVNALFIGTGTGFTDTGDTIGTSMSTITITANTITAITLSTQQLNVSSITGITFLSQANLTSTVIGLGTTGYISSIGGLVSTANLANLVSTANLAGHISTANLLNLVSTANLANLVSTANLANLVSTANLANLVSTANLANLISTANLANLVSTANLANLVSTANLARFISTANLANFVSTTYLSTQLGSTFASLTVSSLSTFSLQGTTAFISSLTVNGLFIGSNQGFVNMGDVIATSVSSLVVYAGGMFSTSNSTQQTFLSSINGVAFANIGSGGGGIAGIPSSLNTSSISTFSLIGTTGFISSLTVNGLFIGSNQGFVNMGDVIATSISSLVVYTGSAFATSNQASITSTQQLNISSINGQTFGGPIASTVIGLGTAGYVSTSQLLSTSLGINLFISTIFVDHPELQSTVAGLGTVGYISSIGGFRLISTANLANLVSTANLANFVSTANLANFVSTANLANLVSTANLANHISTANLANLVSTANLANHISTANLANHISTANLANLVSTTYLTTQLGSTVIGLGTVGYISSAQFLSSFNGISLNFRTSSINTNNLSAGTTYVSSMVINTLQIGLTPGFIQMGDIITTSVSTILTTTNLLNAGINAISSFNVYGGTNQSGLGLRFFGSSIQSPFGQPASMSVSSVSTYTTMYLGTFDQYALGRGASLGFGANNINGLQTLQGRITGTPTTNTVSGGDQGTLNFEVNDSGRMFNTMTMWAIGGQGRVGINCNSPSFNFDLNGTMRVSSTATFASNVLHTGGLASFMSNSGLFSNLGTATFASNVLYTGGLTSFMSNSGLFSNAAAVTFASNLTLTSATSFMSNSGLFSNAGIATFASNVLLTGGTSSYLSNSGLFSNAAAATFNSNITIQQNITSIATPSTANSFSLLTLNIPTAGSATTLAPIISLVGGYGASIAGGLTQSVGPVLSLGTIAGSGQPTVEGYRMTGTNSVFYGNVTVGNPGSNNTITIQTGGTITVPTGAGGLGNNAYLLLNTVNNTAYLGGDYVFLQPAGNISFYRDFYTGWPATFTSTVNISGRLSNSGNTFLTGTFLSNSGLFSNAGTTTFASNVLQTGATSFISNSGLFSNAGISRFASNVFLTGGTNTSGLSINSTSNINFLQIHGNTSTAQSTNPDGGANFPIVITSPKSGSSIYAMSLGVDNTTGFGFINAAGNGGTQPILLNSRGGNVGIGSSSPSFPLDVNGVARSAIPISSLTGISATFANSSYGIYYYITNSAFATINLVGGAPSPAAGWYVSLRNNTGSYLSCTITGAVSSTPASPLVIPPLNTVTIAYDSATSLYVLF